MSTDNAVVARRRRSAETAVLDTTVAEKTVGETGLLKADCAARVSSRGRLWHAVVWGDLVGLAVVCAAVPLLRTNIGPARWGDGEAIGTAAMVACVVVLALLLTRCWDVRVLGAGQQEFVRLAHALGVATVILTVVALWLQDPSFRPWVFGVIPLIGAVLACVRLGVRRSLHRARRAGRRLLRVLVVGPPSAVSAMLDRSRRVPEHGWSVVAASVVGGGDEVLADGVVRVEAAEGLGPWARQHHIDLVAVAAGAGWPSVRLRRLAWELEEIGIDLVVDPGFMDVAGPRLRIEVMDGAPLLRLAEPGWRGAAWWAKSVVDRLVSAVLLTLLAPLLLVIAGLVALDGGRPLYRQHRLGRGGVPFRMVKFRTMAVGADRLLPDVIAENGGAHDGSGPMFKLRQDPRVTPVGRVLRRYSLDELPQLCNVLAGSMSLVGPRPPLPAEMAGHEDDQHRKLRVRPGLTGLWQVSGRSDLSWDDSIRLDLRYVESWSHGLDLAILARTLRAVISGRGAY